MNFMKMRVKYVRHGADWRYELQVKKWLFWKTVDRFVTLKRVEEFLDTLKEVDEFNKRFDSNPLVEKTRIALEQIELLRKLKE